MFEFPVTVENLEEVPDEFRSLYQIKDGETSATLNEALRKRIEVGSGATRALESERKSRATAEKAVSAWKGKAKELFEVESIDDLATKWTEIEAAHAKALEEARNASGNKDEQAEKRIAQALEQKDRELAKKLKQAEEEKQTAIKERDAMYGSLETYMRENAAVQALAASKARGKILLPHVMRQTKIIHDDGGKYLLRVVDEDGDERVNGDGKPMTVDDLVAQMRQSEDYSFAFDGDGATGSNSRSTTTTTRSPKTNPWSKKSFNATEQAKIVKSNPTLAKQLESQAAAEDPRA
jgi:hypothetical protein